MLNVVVYCLKSNIDLYSGEFEGPHSSSESSSSNTLGLLYNSLSEPNDAFNINDNSSNELISFDDKVDEYSNMTNYKIDGMNMLGKWAIQYNISHVALNSLPKIIPKIPHKLPMDARTLLGPARKVNFTELTGNDGLYQYSYIGLKEALLGFIIRC